MLVGSSLVRFLLMYLGVYVRVRFRTVDAIKGYRTADANKETKEDYCYLGTDNVDFLVFAISSRLRCPRNGISLGTDDQQYWRRIERRTVY